MRTAVGVVGLGLVLLGFSSALAAQPLPPDVVRLRDGTFLRGTIVERSPAQLVIMLPTGETRTYPADQVESAGPTATEQVPPPPVATQPPPPPTQPAPTPDARPPGTARIRVWSETPGLSLQQVSGTALVPFATRYGAGVARVDQFSVICNIPCEVDLPEATYQLGVASGEDAAIRVGAPIDLRRDTSLHASYTDNGGIRTTGWILFIGGSVLGTALMVGSLFAGPEECSEFTGSCRATLSMPMLVGGTIVAVLSAAIGIPLAFWGDSAELEERPAP